VFISLKTHYSYKKADRFIQLGRDGNFQAAQLLEQALKEDPQFASAHTLLAWAFAIPRHAPAARIKRIANRSLL